MKYIKQLDSIRAIAVMLVVMWHWVPRNGVLEGLHAGSFGVNIFFVLSGFLITRILLFKRVEAEGPNGSKTIALKNFYARRVLRIFPIYYLTILLTTILSSKYSLSVTKNEVLANLTYTSNFFVYFIKAWPPSSLHFWSLAVEEQFYLAWPLLILFWPKKYLVPVFVVCISAGLLSQLLITNYEFGHLPTATCLDSFGAGGLLAFLTRHQSKFLKRIYKVCSLLAFAGCVALTISWQFDFYLNCTRFIHTIISCWVISHILLNKNRKSPLITIFNSRLLMNIGKVSYGIYLYHILYVYIASDFWYKYVFDYYSSFINVKFEPWIFVLINFPVLYLVAWLSWRYIEKPLLSLKRRFEYAQTVKTDSNSNS